MRTGGRSAAVRAREPQGGDGSDGGGERPGVARGGEEGEEGEEGHES